MVKACRPRVLVVDDEERITTSLSAILRRDFEVIAVTSGRLGLEAIDSLEPFDVIVSDMQMPEMNGARFLARARESAPYSQRILLTGQADFESAAAAVNEGQVFRFLTKPCTPNALREVLHSAAELRKVQAAESSILQETLVGTVQVLTDTLGLLHPALARRTTRVTQAVVTLADELKLEDKWQFKAAAMLANLGCVTLAPESLAAVLSGTELSESRMQEWMSLPQVTADLISHIPRIECAAAIISSQLTVPPPSQYETPINSWTTVLQGAELLRTATMFVDAVDRGQSPAEVIEEMVESESFSPEILAALPSVTFRRARGESRSVTAAELTVGVELLEDLKDGSGTTLASAGTTVGETLIKLARRYSKRGELAEPVEVRSPSL